MYNIYTIYKIYTSFEKLSWKELFWFHRHEHKCSRSTPTSPLLIFPITFLFKFFFYKTSTTNFFVILILYHTRIENNLVLEVKLLRDKANKCTQEYSSPRYCSPATALENSLMSTHTSILLDSVGPPSGEVCRTTASFP